MPRTKQKRVKRSSAGYEQMLRDFNRLMQLKIHKLELEFKSVENKFDASVQVALTRYPQEIQNMTLLELLTPVEETPKKENLPPKTPRLVKESAKKSLMKPKMSMSSKRVTAASDDGYQSESTASQASKMASATGRRSRSISRDRAKQKSQLLANTQKTQKTGKKDLFQTPDHKTTNSFVITPKIKLNSAINVLRKPKDGEMVFSTSGSPLLVSTTVNDKTANINVPLRNGTVVSLLPFNETSLTEDIRLDDETKLQLKILQSHLNKVLK